MDYKKIGYKIIDMLTDEWFDSLEEHPEIYFYPVNYSDIRCWGSCEQHDWEVGAYVIHVATDQPLRDFVATIVHEMVHVRQWVFGKWRGNGEKEALRLQYKIADKIWKGDLL